MLRHVEHPEQDTANTSAPGTSSRTPRRHGAAFPNKKVVDPHLLQVNTPGHGAGNVDTQGSIQNRGPFSLEGRPYRRTQIHFMKRRRLVSCIPPFPTLGWRPELNFRSKMMIGFASASFGFPSQISNFLIHMKAWSGSLGVYVFAWFV